MVPPADPKSIRKGKFNPAIIAELDELGILDDVSDLIFNMPNSSIPEIQKAIADRFSYTDMGTPEIEHLRNGFTPPQTYGNGRGYHRRKNHKTIGQILEEDYGIANVGKDEK